MNKIYKLVIAISIITVTFGTMYMLVLQQNRLQANDVPNNIATEVVNVLRSDANIPEDQFTRLDVLKTINPFFMVYDTKGNAIAGSGYIDGKLAELPAGVIQHAKPGKNHAVTWAPTKNSRFATITIVSNKFYVTSGQSLANVERRADTLRKWWLLGYSLALVVTIVGSYVVWFRKVKTPLVEQLATQTNPDTIKEVENTVDNQNDSGVIPEDQ